VIEPNAGAQPDQHRAGQFIPQEKDLVRKSRGTKTSKTSLTMFLLQKK
jgi:hypothetical protein